MKVEINILKKIDMLSPLNEEELLQIFSRMKSVTLEKGKELFREGDTGNEMYIVIEGNVSILVNEDVEVAVVNAGSFFGEMSIFEEEPRSATCIAKEKSFLFAFGKKDFFNLMDNYPETAIKIMQRMLTTTAMRLQNTGSFLSDMVIWGESARKRAVTDEFTGFFNRRFLDDALEEQFSNARLNRQNLSLVMVDLDNFGTLNKLYGEALVDKGILATADIFRQVFRENDILARYGGDEFTFILPDTCQEKALEICNKAVEQLRTIDIFQEVKAKDVSGAMLIKNITASIGIASYPSHASSLKELKEKSDKAVYMAKECGKNKAVLYNKENKCKAFFNSCKVRIPTVAEKNRIIKNIITVMDTMDNFILVGHKNPDEDCIASMIAFAILLRKFNKKVDIIFYKENHRKFTFLLNICKYNRIGILSSSEQIGDNYSTLAVFDTAKPSMLDGGEKIAKLMADENFKTVEFDHHLEADSGYSGTAGYCLVDEASSSCELVAVLAYKLTKYHQLLETYMVDDIFSRNFVLSVITGMICDSKMGKYLKTKRERFFFNKFMTALKEMLESKTNTGSGNFSKTEDIFEELEKMSESEEECYKYFLKKKKKTKHITYALLDVEDMKHLYSIYDQDVIVSVSRYSVDVFAAESGFFGFLAYFDNPEISNLVQFRMRRSQNFTGIDLRIFLEKAKITTGGGHPGAVGFRFDRNEKEVSDYYKFCEETIAFAEQMIEEELKKQ